MCLKHIKRTLDPGYQRVQKDQEELKLMVCQKPPATEGHYFSSLKQPQFWGLIWSLIEMFQIVDYNEDETSPVHFMTFAKKGRLVIRLKKNPGVIAWRQPSVLMIWAVTPFLVRQGWGARGWGWGWCPGCWRDRKYQWEGKRIPGSGHSLGTCSSAHIPVAFPFLNRDGGALDAALPLG